MNIHKHVKKWREQDDDDKVMSDIFALRVKDIDDRITIMMHYLHKPHLNKETVSFIMSYIQDCLIYKEDYTTKIEFFEKYQQWKQQQQVADDSETSQVETDNPPRQELNKLREENKKNKEEVTRNGYWDFVDAVTGNPYLVRGGVPDL